MIIFVCLFSPSRWCFHSSYISFGLLSDVNLYVSVCGGGWVVLSWNFFKFSFVCFNVCIVYVSQLGYLVMLICMCVCVCV